MDDLIDGRTRKKILIWTKDKRGKLRTSLKEAWERKFVVAQREAEELKDAKKCLAGFTKSSKLPWQCHGMFPGPEHHGNNAVAHELCSLPCSLQIL